MNEDRLLQLVGIALVGFIGLAVVTGILVAIDPGSDDGGPSETEWSGSALNATHFEIVYVDGAPLPADSLIVSVDGYQRHGTWSGQVRPGDTGLVRVSEDSVVRLYWVAESGPRELLADWTV